MRVVYLITPSWLVKKKKELAGGVKNLEKFGFKVLNGRRRTSLPSPREKARELHSAFLNKKVDVVLAQRGGYSAMKLLPHVDFELIGRNPKIFAGFSDVSALLNPLFERAGLVTLHAPMAINLAKPSSFTVNSFLNALNGFPEKNLLARAPLKVYHAGKGRGILKGGNLVTLTALLDTAWEMETAGAILFFEEVDEKLHKVDRCLTQWILAGKFKRIKGLILGDFRGIRSEDVYKIFSSQMKIEFPAVHCPYIGHVRHKITLPVGARAELDTSARSLILR